MDWALEEVGVVKGVEAVEELGEENDSLCFNGDDGVGVLGLDGLSSLSWLSSLLDDNGMNSDNAFVSWAWIKSSYC